MRISACYITKNEAENIYRSIKSIRAQVDEIVVVDTGSIDRTIEIAQKLGAKVSSYVWQDSFALARNYALAKATGDWIVLLDADEYFSTGTAGNLRTIIECCDARQCDGLLIKMNNIDSESEALLDSFYQLRVVRRQEGLAYKGRIHEELFCCGKILRNLQQISPDMLQIIHTGYSQKLSKDKALRNLALLQMELAGGRSECELYRYFCDCYDGLGEKKKAIYYAWLDVRHGRRNVSYGSQCYRKLLSYYAELGDRESAQKRFEVATLAVRFFQEVPDFHAEYGECLAQFYRYGEAAGELSRALELYNGYSGLEPCLLTDKNIGKIRQRLAFFTNMAQKAENIKISACLIVKDEEENISKWLDNVKLFADEVIVMDTGSQDGTCAIAEQRVGVCYHHVWQGNFAVARNEALEKATGDWIVFVDADELFVSPGSVRGYLAFLQENGSQAEAVFVPLENIDLDNNSNLLDMSYVIRMFKNKCGIFYTGAIHEQLTKNGRDDEGIMYVTGDVALRLQHTGYSARYIQTKLQRNLQMLQQETCSSNNVEKYYYFLAETYFALGYAQQALDNALLAVRAGVQPIGASPGKMFIIALEAMKEIGYTADDRLAVAEEGLARFTQCGSLYGGKGLCLIEKGRWQEALICLEKALMLNIGEVAASGIDLLKLKVAVALCRKHLGNIGDARQTLKEVLAEDKWYEDAIVGLAGTYSNNDYTDLTEYLMGTYSVGEYKAILNILELNGFFLLYKDVDEAVHGDILLTDEHRWYQSIQKGAYGLVAEEVLPSLVGGIQRLFVALLGRHLNFSDSMVKMQICLLPQPLQELISLYHGRQCDAVPLYEDYISMLDAVLLYGNENIAKKYIDLSKLFFTAEKVFDVIRVLQEKDKLILAGELYIWLADSDYTLSADFWFSYGVFCYSIGEYHEALLAFERVLSMGGGNPELEAYITWSKEAGRC